MIKIRHKGTGEICHTGDFNTHSLCEIIVYYSDDCDSDYISNFDVWIEAKQGWVDLSEAFRNKGIITDNYNTYFFEPKTEEDRVRGYTL